MIFDLFGDVTLRECLAAALGASVGMIGMIVATLIVDHFSGRGERVEADPYEGPFADTDHWTGHRNQFWR